MHVQFTRLSETNEFIAWFTAYWISSQLHVSDKCLLLLLEFTSSKRMVTDPSVIMPSEGSVVKLCLVSEIMLFIMQLLHIYWKHQLITFCNCFKVRNYLAPKLGGCQEPSKASADVQFTKSTSEWTLIIRYVST